MEVNKYQKEANVEDEMPNWSSCRLSDNAGPSSKLSYSAIRSGSIRQRALTRSIIVSWLARLNGSGTTSEQRQTNRKRRHPANTSLVGKPYGR